MLRQRQLECVGSLQHGFYLQRLTSFVVDVVALRGSWGYSLRDVRLEAMRILRMALPVLLAYLLQMCLGLSQMITVGPLGKEYTAAAALGTMFGNVTGFSVGMGMATGIPMAGTIITTTTTWGSAV